VLIRWTKSDGQGKPDALTCIRDDKTTLYARLSPYFPLHDLLHYAVETTLGFKEAFWGLLGQGWTIKDFAEKDPVTGKVRRVPLEADLAERLVGFLQLAETGSLSGDPEEIISLLNDYCQEIDVALPSWITPDRVVAARALIGELRGQWLALPPGGALELSFP